MTNNTDYNKPHSDVYDLLPQVFKSDVNKALSENVFNRFLSKTELVNVVGNITNNPTDPRRIKEIDVDRQNNQLQPLIYTKIANIDHISSTKDLIRELVRLGVDYNRLNEWLSTEQFNFCPPIDLDKIVNFIDYFWMDESEPQYITIKNRLSQLTIIVNQAFADNATLQSLIDLYIVEANPVQKDLYAQQIELIYPGFVLIYEEYLYLFNSLPANVIDMQGWDGIVNGLDIVNISGNSFIVSGYFASIINSLSSIRIKDGVNAGTYTIASPSTYDVILNQTTIPVVEVIINPSNFSGLVDVGTYDSPVDGFDIIQVSANQFTIQEDYTTIFNVLDSFDVLGGPNANTYTVLSCTFSDIDNTTTIAVNELLIDPITPGGVIAVGQYDYIQNSTVVIPNPFGFETQKDQWSSANKWVHVSDIPANINTTLITQAVQPIIEYEPFIEMNEWSSVSYNWLYSSNGVNQYNESVQQPSDDEILSSVYSNELSTVLTTSSFEIVASYENPKLLAGTPVTIVYDDGASYSHHTIVSIDNSQVISNSISTIQVDSVINGTFTTARIEPLRYTSYGDDWRGFVNHWIYQSANLPVPCDNQQSSEIFDPTSILFNTSRSKSVSAAGTYVHWYALSDISIFDTDDVRVYVNGQRVYGTYALGYYNGNFVSDPIFGDYNGATTNPSITFQFNPTLRNAIWFYEPILFGDIVVETGPIAQDDVEQLKRLVTVRTAVEDNVGSFVSLVKYKKVEQLKTQVQQYPLFNMFNLDGTTANKASSLWKFLEDPSYPVNSILHKRIVVNGTDYSFQQLLLESDNGVMYGYKQSDNLQTVWRTDQNNKTYVPKYINTNYQEVAIGDDSGDWELPEQMVYNVEHNNRTILTSANLLKHFTTIINSQPTPPGYTGSAQNYWKLSTSPSYGAGGTIKEYNEGFDTLMSSLFVDGVSMIQLIDFAKREYDNSIRRVRTLLIDNIVSLLTTDDITQLHDIQSFVSQSIISLYQHDDFLEQIYGDSTCFDISTGLGVRNWIATLPKLGMMPSVFPKIVQDDTLGLLELTHHDGHKSQPKFESNIINSITKQLRNDANTISGVLSGLPDVADTTQSMIYYSTDTNQFFKCIVSVYGNIQPSNLPNGSLWYDTSTLSLKQNISGTYQIISNDLCWNILQFDIIYANVLLEIENRLFQVCQTQDIVYDVNLVKSDIQYALNEQKQFAQFTSAYNIANPMESIYNASNAFSWNYSSVSGVDYRVTTQPSGWVLQLPSTWYNIYEQVFGTRHPQAEPWVMQKYSSKPIWWDIEYNINPNRRWTMNMWLNILDGKVPSGYAYANGQISTGVYEPLISDLSQYETVPVNVTDNVTTDNVYNPDDLLPPYYNPSNPLDINVVTYGSMLTTLPNQTSAALPYVYGQNGFTEDTWRRSIEFNYSLTSISFITQPMRFMYSTFGNKLQIVDSLQVDIKTNNIPSHRDTLFHGDMLGNEVYINNGTNQWYVNFFRFNGNDLNISDFRQMWTSWTPVLSYQMSSFADPRSVSLRNDTAPYDVSDYNLRTKRTPGFKDYYLDSLRAVINTVGTSTYVNGSRAPVNKGIDWRFRLDTSNPKHVPITVYSVDVNQPGVSFNILNKQVTNETWYHYPINSNVKYTFIPGSIVDDLGPDYVGIQGMINLIDGYVAYLTDCGFVFTDSTYNEIDGELGRINDWQLQLELLVEQIYIGMASDELPINFVGKWGFATVDTNTNTFTSSVSNTFSFANNEQVQLYSTGKLPSPFVEHKMYQLINVNTMNRTFQLAEVGSNVAIVISSIGTGTLSYGMYRVQTSTPQSFYEINPFKNTIVFDNDLGIISNVHEGSFKDDISEQGVYDQYGRPINTKNIRVYRGDKRSFLRMFNNVSDITIPNNTLHIGGMHLFLDGYEHAIMFNNTSIDGSLLFDSFLGLQITKVKIDIRTNYTKTFRPNLGGRFLSDDAQVPNVEAMIGELQYMYDTNLADEDSNMTKSARNLLGFQPRDYLTQIGITDKSQFLFYRGMIQQKGSVNAITAYINLKNFIDAGVDDYWAYKVANFGDARQKQFPQLNVFATDTSSNQLLLRFKTENDQLPLNDVKDIVLQDQTRWNNQPQQMRQIFNDVPNLHFESEVTTVDTMLGSDVFSQQYIKLSSKCDNVTIIATNPTPTTYSFVVGADGPTTLTLPARIIPNSGAIRIIVSRNNESGNTVPSTEIFEDQNGINVTVNRYCDSTGNISDLLLGDVIDVIVGNSVLVEDTHYTRINNQTIFFDALNPEQDMSIADQISFYALNVAKQKLNPVKLIDKVTDTNLQNVVIWDPAKGFHYHNIDVIIKYKSDDPAYYTQSPIITDNNVNLAWLERSVGDVWLDTTHVSYKPYFDNKLVTTWNQRLEMWGQLEDWSTNNLYEWVKSPVHPSEYTQYVSTQQKAGVTISGTARSCLFKRTRDIGTQLFEPYTWVEVKDVIVTDIVPQVDGYFVDISSHSSYVDVGATFNVYQNGKYIGFGNVASNYIISLTSYSTNPYAFITVVIPQYVPTTTQLAFNPDVKDDITIDVQYKVDYKYCISQRVSPNLTDIDTIYYFWVSNTATNHNGVSLNMAQQQLTKIPQPYITFDNLLNPVKFTNVNNITNMLPSRYTRCALRGLVNKVTTDNRFVLQFTRNFTMRDGPLDNQGNLLNDVHSQWKMFRERQQFNIDTYLWNKLVEACSGVLLTDSTTNVPSLDYVLYDQINNTNERFGMRDGQSFCDATRAIQVIIDEINNPQYDLYPIDRQQFLETYTFDSVQNIQLTLKTIYETFLPRDVNRIWFAVLFETLASNNRFTDIFKTSWVQLDGVRLLDTTGDLR
jgi:hypothetical protein